MRNTSSVLSGSVQRTLVNWLLRLPQLGAEGLGGELARTLLGGLLGGLGRRIFGGGSAERGATAAQPVYTQDVGVSSLLTELLAATRALQLRGLGRGIDELSSELGLQRMRAGAEVQHA